MASAMRGFRSALWVASSGALRPVCHPVLRPACRSCRCRTRPCCISREGPYDAGPMRMCAGDGIGRSLSRPRRARSRRWMRRKGRRRKRKNGGNQGNRKVRRRGSDGSLTRLSLRGLEGVTDAVHGPDHLRAELVAQGLHVGIHRTGAGSVHPVPDLFQELLAG